MLKRKSARLNGYVSSYLQLSIEAHARYCSRTREKDVPCRSQIFGACSVGGCQAVGRPLEAGAQRGEWSAAGFSGRAGRRIWWRAKSQRQVLVRGKRLLYPKLLILSYIYEMLQTSRRTPTLPKVGGPDCRPSLSPVLVMDKTLVRNPK